MHSSSETGHEHGREYNGFLRRGNRLQKTGENAAQDYLEASRAVA